jgi:hypothetical protein
MRSRPKANPLIADLLAGITALRLAGNPEALAARAGLVPDPWQLRVLRSSAQTMLINCSRQAGKSTTVALLIVSMLLQPAKTVVITAPAERQSKELYRKVLNFWRRLERPVGHAVVNRTSLELVNESRLIALPGSPDTIRGFSSVDLLVADEAALIPDDLYNAVTPMLAVSNGRLVALSTPSGKRGWWYNLWILRPDEDPDIERVEAHASEIPRISAAFLARERRRLGSQRYDQEYDCQFLDDERQAFRTVDIEAAQVEMETWDWCLDLRETA